MKKTTKILALALAFILVAGIAVAGTVAYLTSTPDSIENTFKVGKVNITLDEHLVGADGKIPTTNAALTDDTHRGNLYTIVPGKTYDKDPTVHVLKGSEECFVFVKVENGIASYEVTGTDANTIAKQIADNGWTQLKVNNVNVPGVFYKEQDAIAEDGTDADLDVFSTFTINPDLTATDLADATSATVKITAYAIQAEGFATAEAAWIASGFGD